MIFSYDQYLGSTHLYLHSHFILLTQRMIFSKGKWYIENYIHFSYSASSECRLAWSQKRLNQRSRLILKLSKRHSPILHGSFSCFPQTRSLAKHQFRLFLLLFSHSWSSSGQRSGCSGHSHFLFELFVMLVLLKACVIFINVVKISLKRYFLEIYISYKQNIWYIFDKITEWTIFKLLLLSYPC